MLKQQQREVGRLLELNLKSIKKQRIEQKKTLQDLADALDYKSASTYMKHEKGDHAFKANQLPMLAFVLNCSIMDFFSEKDC